MDHCKNCGSKLGIDCGEAEPDYNEDFCSVGCWEENRKVPPLVLGKVPEYIADWCDWGDAKFHSYPEDGQCVCGCFKHHVHCLCGRIMQVG